MLTLFNLLLYLCQMSHFVKTRLLEETLFWGVLGSSKIATAAVSLSTASSGRWAKCVIFLCFSCVSWYSHCRNMIFPRGVGEGRRGIVRAVREKLIIT